MDRPNRKKVKLNTVHRKRRLWIVLLIEIEGKVLLGQILILSLVFERLSKFINLL